MADVVAIEAKDRGVVLDPKATTIELTNGDLLRGSFGGGDEVAVTISTEGLGRLRVNQLMIREIRFAQDPGSPVTVRPSATDDQDAVVLRPRGDVLAGTIRDFTRDEVHVEYDVTGEVVVKKFADVIAIQFRKALDPPDPKSIVGIVETQDGCRVHAHIESMADRVLHARSVYEDEMFDEPLELEVPVGRIDSITMQNGRFVYLSDLEPDEAKSEPYFDEEWDWVRDKSWFGTPLSIGGKTWQKGIGTHARFLLTFRLAEGFQRFASTVGIDDSVVESTPFTRGGAVFRVHADGKKVFDSGIVTRESGGREVDVPIAGVKTLVLEVDYGPNGPVNARADWAGAKLLR